MFFSSHSDTLQSNSNTYYLVIVDRSTKLQITRIFYNMTITNVDPTIIFENKYLVAINKPAGLVVHPDGKTHQKTLCDWIVSKWPEIKGVGEPAVLAKGTEKEQVIDRPGIVHRLDKETSGIMIIAKTQESFDQLKNQFQERETEKTYRTFVWGLVKEDEGVISRPIGRSKTDFRKWSAERFARGELRDAETQYKVLERASQVPFGPNETSVQNKIAHYVTYLEVYPKTGRTHQIRVHLKAINHPIVCDYLYGPNHPQILGFERTALHAYRLKITDLDGVLHEFEAQIPDDFEQAYSMLVKSNIETE